MNFFHSRFTIEKTFLYVLESGKFLDMTGEPTFKIKLLLTGIAGDDFAPFSTKDFKLQ